jgi:archaellum component FlaC
LDEKDRTSYEENLEEETKMRVEKQETNKSLDLMRKLTDYLGH